jgi:hypothetical protein
MEKRSAAHAMRSCICSIFILFLRLKETKASSHGGNSFDATATRELRSRERGSNETNESALFYSQVNDLEATREGTKTEEAQGFSRVEVVATRAETILTATRKRHL